MGEALADPPSFLFLQRSATSRAYRPALQQSYFSPDDPGACRPARQQSRSGPTTPTRSGPTTPTNNASSVGAVCGNESSFTNKTDHSVTDGINTEHKQKQRQSAKDAGSARRRRQQTSWHIRSDASQHERGGGAPPHQPTPDRRVRATHQAAQQTQEGHNIPPHEGQHNLDIPRGAETKAESSRARGHGSQLAPGEEGNGQRKEALQPTKKRAGQTSDEDGALKDKATRRGLQRKMENGPRKGTKTSKTVWAHLNPRDDNVTHLGGSPP